MHFIVAWDMDASGKRELEIVKQLESCLTDYAWVSPVNNVYIIGARNSVDYIKVRNGLTRMMKQFPDDEVNFIMGPIMKGGQYDGLLPEDVWDDVNKITG